MKLIHCCSSWYLKVEWCFEKELLLIPLNEQLLVGTERMKWSCSKLERRASGSSTGRKVLKIATVATSNIEKLPNVSMNVTRSSRHCLKHDLHSFPWLMSFRKNDVNKGAFSIQAAFTAMQKSQEIISLENKTVSHLHSCLGWRGRDYENKTLFQVKSRVLPVKYNLRISIKTKGWIFGDLRVT